MTLTTTSMKNWTYEDYHKHFFHETKEEDLDKDSPCCEIGQTLKRAFPGICGKTWTGLHESIERRVLFPLFQAAVQAKSRGESSFSLKKEFPTYLTPEVYRSLFYRIHGLWAQTFKVSPPRVPTTRRIHPCQCGDPCSSYNLNRIKEWEFVNVQLPTQKTPLEGLKKLGTGTEEFLKEELTKELKKHNCLTDENVPLAMSLIQKTLTKAIGKHSWKPITQWTSKVENEDFCSFNEQELKAVSQVLFTHWGLLVDWPLDDNKDLISFSFASPSPELRPTPPCPAKLLWEKRQNKKRGGLHIQTKDGSTIFASKQLVKKHCGRFFDSLKKEGAEEEVEGKGGKIRAKVLNTSKQSIMKFFAWAHGVPLSSEGTAEKPCADLYSLARIFGVGELLKELHDTIHLGMSIHNFHNFTNTWTGQKGTEELILRCLALVFSSNVCEYQNLINNTIVELQYPAWRSLVDGFSSEQEKHLVHLSREINPGNVLDESTVSLQLDRTDKTIRNHMWNRYQRKINTNLELKVSTKEGEASFSVHQCVLQALPTRALERIQKQRRDHVEGLTVPSEKSFSLFLEFLYRKEFPSTTQGNELTDVYQIALDLNLPEIQKELIAILPKYISVNAFEKAWEQWVPGTRDTWMNAWLQYFDKDTSEGFKNGFVKHLSYKKAMAADELSPWKQTMKTCLDEFKEALRDHLKRYPSYLGSDSEKVQQWIAVKEDEEGQ